MADEVSPDSDPSVARTRLDLDPAATTIALLPGSRVGEVSRLAEPMVEAARILASRRPDLQFVAAMANQNVHTIFRETMERLAFNRISLFDHDPRAVIAASDAVMCASGTATLETMLVNRPMVAAYRVSPYTYQLVKHLRLIKSKLFALPNILAGEALVPELIQRDATGERLAVEIERWLKDENSRLELRERFLELHERLRCDASKRASEAVCGLLDR
jgi:lipid-A-disaccharide synthase